MKKVFAEWPGEIIQNPFEIGKQVMFPASIIEKNLGYEGLNPVVEGYKLYNKMPYNRPSWDILSVIYLMKPELFTKSVSGTVSVNCDEKVFISYACSFSGCMQPEKEQYI